MSEEAFIQLLAVEQGFTFNPLSIDDTLTSGFPIHREQLMTNYDTRLTFSPRANTACPAAFMFFAALWSRSCSVLHLGQVQWRTDRSNSSNLCPHSEQSLLDGNHRSIETKVRPYQSALYSNWRTNSPQLQSLIDLANLRFLIMFFTLRLSTLITWFSFISFVVSLWVKSFRQSAIFAWILATFSLALRLLLPPNFFLAKFRSAFAKAWAYLAVYFGLPDSHPSSEITIDLIPRSRPDVLDITGSKSASCSQSIDTKYLPAQSFDMNTVEGSHGIDLDHRIFKDPFIFRRLNSPSLNRNDARVYSRDCAPSLHLNFGCLVRPLKNLLYATSKCLNDCCNGVAETSLSHRCSGSLFSAVSRAELS